MRRISILISLFFIFMSCSNLSIEDRIERSKARAEEIKNRVEKKERTKYVVQVIRHPDYSFERTDPKDLIVYDGFEPKKDYLIIGRIIIKHMPDANVDLIRKDIEDKVAIIGGNAILITEKSSKKSIDSKTVGFIMPESLIKYFQVTKEKEKVSSISYQGYVIRWINFGKEENLWQYQNALNVITLDLN